MIERQLAELTQMLLADDPKRGCQRALQVLVARNGARTGALFALSPDQQRLRLFASEGIDQTALDTAAGLYARHRKELAAGEVARQGAAHPMELAAVLSPVMEEDRLVAVLYLDGSAPQFVEQLDAEGVKGFSGVLAAAVTQAAQRPLASPAINADTSYLADTPPDEVRRDQLLVLLERHEWNVARVARAMGCARMTIYSWLSRYGIERRRIRKTRPRTARVG